MMLRRQCIWLGVAIFAFALTAEKVDALDLGQLNQVVQEIGTIDGKPADAVIQRNLELEKPGFPVEFHPYLEQNATAAILVIRRYPGIIGVFVQADENGAPVIGIDANATFERSKQQEIVEVYYPGLNVRFNLFDDDRRPRLLTYPAESTRPR